MRNPSSLRSILVRHATIALAVARLSECNIQVACRSIYTLEGRQPAVFAAEMRMGAVIRRSRRVANPAARGTSGRDVHEPHADDRRQASGLLRHRGLVRSRRLARATKTHGRGRSYQAKARRGRGSSNPLVMPVPLDRTWRGGPRADPSQGRKACPTIQSLNRRRRKLERGQHIRAASSSSTTIRWCAWPSRFACNGTISG